MKVDVFRCGNCRECSVQQRVWPTYLAIPAILSDLLCCPHPRSFCHKKSSEGREMSCFLLQTEAIIFGTRTFLDTKVWWLVVREVNQSPRSTIQTWSYMMGIKFGEIDSTQILHNEFRLNVLEGVINLMIERDPSIKISSDDFNKIRNESVRTLSRKYPNSGIKLIGD